MLLVNLLKKVYRYNEILPNETKEKILKHKRRIEYFIVFIPLMFILLGYSINSVIQKDYTNYKLFYRFAEDFLYKVNLYIFPISLIFLIVVIWIFTMYKPNIVYLFWSSLIVLGLLYVFIPNSEYYLIEFMYQANLIIPQYKFTILSGLSLITITLILFNKKVRKGLVASIKNGIEILLLVSILYLEAIGEYKMFFFSEAFINLFINSMKFFSGMWEIAITVFVSLVFLSLYNKQFMSLIFFIKNKITSKYELKIIKKHGSSKMDIVQVSDKLEMPLLKYKELPNVGVIVPAFNEETTICDTVNSLLKVDYAQDSFLTVVVSDGSTDNTVNILKDKYDMYRVYLEPTSDLLEHRKARAIFVSDMYKNLMLIDKPNGGKADALNLGLDYLPKDIEYVSVIDADSTVDKYCFRILATSAKKNNKIAALTGTILPREQNEDPGFKASLLRNIQFFDYVNSFHGERGALGLLNSILIIPGALGFFKRDVMMEIGGYHQGALAEDGLLTLNIHKKKKTKIKFIPEALLYTQVPSTFSDLRKQRIRWFKGLTELLLYMKSPGKQNLKLNAVFMDYLFIEWITPIMAPLGLWIVISNPKMITYPLFYVFMALAIITPMIQGITCLLMENSYRKVKLQKLAYLPIAVFMSPFLILWRNDALLDLGNRKWGFIKRY